MGEQKDLVLDITNNPLDVNATTDVTARDSKQYGNPAATVSDVDEK